MKRFQFVVLLVFLLTATSTVLAQDDVTTIRLWGGWGTFNDTFDKIIELFHVAHPEIRVEKQEVTGDMDGLIVQIIAGAAPDVYMVRSDDMRSFISQGLVLEVTPFVNRDIELDDFLPAWGSMTHEGKFYGVPSEGGGYRTDAMFVNRDIFAQAGIHPPGPDIESALTYDEWAELARRLTIDRNGDGEPEQWGTHFRPDRWFQFILSNGVSIFNEDWTDTEIDTDEAIEVLDILQHLHYFDRVSAPNSYWFESEGNVAMNLLWRSRLAVAPQTIGDRFDWSLAPMPAGKAGSVGLTNHHPLAINPYTDHADAAWTFLRFTLSEPVQRIVAEEGRATVLRSVALDPEYVFPDGPPYNLMPFVGGDAVDVTRQLEPPGVSRPAGINEALNRLWNGEIPAETAAEQMAELWRAALRERR